MNVKSKARVLLMVFMFSELFTQATSFQAVNEKIEITESSFSHQEQSSEETSDVVVAAAAVTDSDDKARQLSDATNEEVGAPSVGDIYEQLLRTPDTECRENLMVEFQKLAIENWVAQMHRECMEKFEEGCKHRGFDYEEAKKQVESPQPVGLSSIDEFEDSSDEDIRPVVPFSPARLYHLCVDEVAKEYSNKVFPMMCNQCDKNGNTLLHLAAAGGDVKLFKDILQSESYVGALNKQNSCGNTPLHIAVLNGHIEIVKYILEVVSSVDRVTHSEMEIFKIKNRDGETAVSLSQRYFNLSIASLAYHFGDVAPEGKISDVWNRSRISELFNSFFTIMKIIDGYEAFPRWAYFNEDRRITEQEEDILLSAVTKDTMNLSTRYGCLLNWSRIYRATRLTAKLQEFGARGPAI